MISTQRENAQYIHLAPFLEDLIQSEKLSEIMPPLLTYSFIVLKGTNVIISSGQWNLMKTYHNEANTSGITKIALKFYFDFFRQSR